MAISRTSRLNGNLNNCKLVDFYIFRISRRATVPNLNLRIVRFVLVGGSVFLATAFFRAAFNRPTYGGLASVGPTFATRPVRPEGWSDDFVVVVLLRSAGGPREDDGPGTDFVASCRMNGMTCTAMSV